MQALLAKIHDFAQKQPSALAIVNADNHHDNVSYKALHSKITQIKAELQNLALSRLAIYCSNSTDWILVDLAAAAANITVVPMHRE